VVVGRHEQQCSVQQQYLHVKTSKPQLALLQQTYNIVASQVATHAGAYMQKSRPKPPGDICQQTTSAYIQAAIAALRQKKVSNNDTRHHQQHPATCSARMPLPLLQLAACK
jgi:hypothetical protein